MLILTRRVGESIHISDRLITVTVLSIRNDNVRIGIQAPSDIAVHRDEVQQSIERGRKRKEDTQ